MKFKKASPLFTAFVLLMLCVLTFMMFVTISAKYVQTTDPSVFYLSVIPITYDCVLEDSKTFRDRVLEGAADIEILYFCSYERTFYTESGDGPTVQIPRSGIDFDWATGVDVGEVNGSIRFFYDAPSKTGYVISRRSEVGSASNLILANADNSAMFVGMSNLREVYFLDYAGLYTVYNPKP